MLSLFPRDQVLFYRTDALWRVPYAILDQVASFLNVTGRAEIKKGYFVPVFAWESSGMSLEDRRFLDELYADEINRTARLSGLRALR